MIHLEEGLVSGGRCTCSLMVGFIVGVDKTTYRIRWIDGNITTQIRPDLDEDEDFDFFVEEDEVDLRALRFDHAHDHRKNWEG